MRPSKRPSVALGLLLVTAVLVGACGSGGGSETGASSTAPGSGSAGDIGAEMFAQRCAVCHGADLSGTEQGPSLYSEVYEPGHHPDESFRAAIQGGAIAHHWSFGNMPPITGLDDEQIDAVIAYVRARQDEHGFEAYPPE